MSRATNAIREDFEGKEKKRKEKKRKEKKRKEKKRKEKKRKEKKRKVLKLIMHLKKLLIVNLEVDNDDVQELLDSHNQEQTSDELIEMHKQLQGNEELQSLDLVQSETRKMV
ncbi:hypothetical protein TNCV_3409341 [Trichonephila clavipes]|nr:hypothetical protein TNCV_3409341 [Trichonephila clavipes]